MSEYRNFTQNTRLAPITESKPKPETEPEHWTAHFELIPAPIGPQTISNSTEFLFIVKPNNTFVNVFETSNSFTLTKNYKYKDNDYLSITHKNYFATNQSLRSVYGIATSISINKIPTTGQFASIQDFTEIVKCDEKSRIDIYIYKVNNNNILPNGVYSTVGDLFVYKYGIASTQDIIIFDSRLQKPTFITQPNSDIKHQTATGIIHKIQTQLKIKMKQIYNINAIPANKMNIDAYNILYIKIYPTTNVKHQYELYILLLKYIDLFYWYKYSSTKHDYELKKDYFMYGNSEDVNTFKQKYKNIEGTSVCMHIFDFLYLMMFVKNKITTNNQSTNADFYKYCNILVDYWINGIAPADTFNNAVNNLKQPTINVKTYVICKDSYGTKDNFIFYPNTKDSEKNVYGPYTLAIPLGNRDIKDVYKDIFDNIKQKLNDSNYIIFWFGPYTSQYITHQPICYMQDVNDDEYNNIINDIITYTNYKNGNNPYLIPYTHKMIDSTNTLIQNELFNEFCIDEYCNTKIGCFSLNFKIIPTLHSTYFKNNIKINDTREIVIIGCDDNNNKNYININKLKSIIYDKDVYIANNYRENDKSTELSSEVFYKAVPKMKKDNAIINYLNNTIHKKNNEFNEFTPTTIKYLNSILQRIDNVNKKTTLGMFEIIDSISKLGRVNTICNKYTI